jgi:hypothetical protein
MASNNPLFSLELNHVYLIFITQARVLSQLWFSGEHGAWSQLVCLGGVFDDGVYRKQ